LGTPAVDNRNFEFGLQIVEKHIIPETMELNPWGSIRKMLILRVKNME
jgi:hypothetical protein